VKADNIKQNYYKFWQNILKRRGMRGSNQGTRGFKSRYKGVKSYFIPF